MRVVIDTNVIISGLFWTGNPKRIFNLVRCRKITYLTSHHLLSETRRILVDPSKSFHLADEELERVMETLNALATLISPRSQVTVCRDGDDNRVLECALDGKADFIVTGDLDLLDLKQFQGIRIVTATEFLASQEWE